MTSGSPIAFRYDPSTNTWTWMSRSADGAVLSALSPIVWTGTEMLVWSVESGGFLVYQARAGGRDDPMTDSLETDLRDGRP